MRFALRRVAASIVAALLWSSGVFAADPLHAPAPFSAPTSPPPSEVVLVTDAANRALQIGLPSVADELTNTALARTDLTLELRNQLLLLRVSALLEENQVKEAEQTLQQFSGPPTPASRLRAAMVSARQRRFDAARTDLAAVKPEDIADGDRGWYYYTQGLLANAAKDLTRAILLYGQAADAANGSLSKARFILAGDEARLIAGDTSDANIASLRQQMERNAGGNTGYSAVGPLATALYIRGDRGGAISVLQTQLQYLPRDQRLRNDEWSLLLGIIAGPGDGVGRNALRNLLTSGVDRDKQRVALQLLARNAKTDAARRDEFRAKLDELIGLPKPHPLLEELLLFRAQLALNDRKNGQPDLARAEEDASQLLQQFPGSQLKGYALGILTNVAWERGQYRNAANLAARSREQVEPGETRARLGLLIAEADFRAKDYSTAAEAYASAIAEAPTGVALGDLMFQQVMSLIAARQLEPAAKLLDERSHDARFDTQNRWRAEWNLARALQANGNATLAYGRLNQLLDIAPDSVSIPPDLRARMRWLQAQLSFEVGEPQRTVALTTALLNDLKGLDAALTADIASTTLLLEIQASFAANKNTTSASTTELLKRLRADYPGTDAAVRSFFFEAETAARNGQLGDAQGLLKTVADNFPSSPRAPLALYQAAGYAEQQGQSRNYQEANNLLDKLVTTYRGSDLVFYARMRQGDLLRKLQEFGRAEQVYSELDNNPAYANHPERIRAQLALADTAAFQSGSDPSHLETALRIYERLLDLPNSSAPLELRAEAGYKYGLRLSLVGRASDAIRAWGLVVDLLHQASDKPEAFGAEGRYWLSRTLVSLGDLLRREGKIDQAREAYGLVLRTGLPYGSVAQDEMAKLAPGAAGSR